MGPLTEICSVVTLTRVAACPATILEAPFTASRRSFTCSDPLILLGGYTPPVLWLLELFTITLVSNSFLLWTVPSMVRLGLEHQHSDTAVAVVVVSAGNRALT